MAKNKNNNRSQKQETEFSQEVVASNIKHAAQNNPSQSTNSNAKQ